MASLSIKTECFELFKLGLIVSMQQIVEMCESKKKVLYKLWIWLYKRSFCKRTGKA